MKSSCQLLSRGLILFLIGTCFTIVLSILQNRHHSSFLNPQNSDYNRIYSRWWLPLICGSGSAVVGLLSPWLVCKSETSMKSQDWSHVLRCMAMFVGINEACTKVDFPSNLQLCASLAILSIGLWWYFDGTGAGFVMGTIIAALATLFTQALAYHEVYIYTDREFSYMQSWLPCVVFSGGITISNIGKQLAVNDFSESENKAHTE